MGALHILHISQQKRVYRMKIHFVLVLFIQLSDFVFAKSIRKELISDRRPKWCKQQINTKYVEFVNGCSTSKIYEKFCSKSCNDIFVTTESPIQTTEVSTIIVTTKSPVVTSTGSPVVTSTGSPVVTFGTQGTWDMRLMSSMTDAPMMRIPYDDDDDDDDNLKVWSECGVDLGNFTAMNC